MVGGSTTESLRLFRGRKTQLFNQGIDLWQSMRTSMIKFFKTHGIFILALTILSLISITGMKSVPFHPDESTYLFMTADFFEFIHDPLSLTSTEFQPGIRKVQYRLIDAPLTRYLAGFALLLAGESPPTVDWDWGATAEENEIAGGVPDAGQLNAGRIMMTALLAASLVFIYLSGLNLAGRWVGLVAVILMGTNSVLLLHTRRVMAESPLLLGTSIFIWALTSNRTRPFALGFAVGLAINAKHSALALLPLTLLPFILDFRSGLISYKQALIGFFQLSITCLILTILLNPIYWRDPIQAGRAALDYRQDLLARQVEETRRLAPNQVLETPIDRTVSLIANAFILDPRFSEVGNYDDWLANSIEIYNSRPETNLLRGPVLGGLSMFLFLFGFSAGCLTVVRRHPLRRQLFLLVVATITQLGAILIAIPLPWQRYTVPALAFISLWMAYGLVLNGRIISHAVAQDRDGPVAISTAD
jgi:hypothetical protein